MALSIFFYFLYKIILVIIINNIIEDDYAGAPEKISEIPIVSHEHWLQILCIEWIPHVNFVEHG